MSDSAWQFLSVMVVQVAGVLIVYLKLRKHREVLDKAVELSEPTGNGFANEVREALAELKTLGNRNYDIANEAREEVRKHIDDHYLAAYRDEHRKKKKQ